MMRTLNDLEFTGKRLVIRLDLNVPMDNGKITNLSRIHAAIPTLQLALKRHAGVIILSHLGRPTEGKVDAALSLAPVATALADELKTPVRFEKNYLRGVKCEPGEIVLCENVRFNVGENANDPALAKQYASLGDIFVMDAFGTAHRAQASTVGVAQFATVACAGPLLKAEIQALTTALISPERPLLAIVGGAKVSTKLNVLKGLLKIVDQLILGGGLANTLLAANGYAVGKSLHEPDLIPEIKALLEAAKQQNKLILTAQDVVTATEFSASAQATVRTLTQIRADEMILDIGPKTIAHYQEAIAKAGTIIWNGPIGVFEFPAFRAGTRAITQAIAQSAAYSLAGGGETIAAIDEFSDASDFDYVSTGGGAFLEYLEGRELPGIAILRQPIQEKVKV